MWMTVGGSGCTCSAQGRSGERFLSVTVKEILHIFFFLATLLGSHGGTSREGTDRWCALALPGNCKGYSRSI